MSVRGAVLLFMIAVHAHASSIPNSAASCCQPDKGRNLDANFNRQAQEVKLTWDLPSSHINDKCRVFDCTIQEASSAFLKLNETRQSDTCDPSTSQTVPASFLNEGENCFSVICEQCDRDCSKTSVSDKACVDVPEGCGKPGPPKGVGAFIGDRQA